MKRKNLLTLLIAVSFIFAAFANIVRAQDEDAEEGKIIAGIDFDPKTDGFGFQNYGRKHDGSEDLDAADLIQMFGADKVCIEGSTAADCVLYETADQWREWRIEQMIGGHCEGFSVTTMRNWLELPFRGKVRPTQWQKEAEVTHDLELDGDLANYIAYYHTLQSLSEVSKFKSKTFKFKPTAIVKLLIESFQSKKEFYTLNIGMRDNGKWSRGHSILPYAIEDMGDGDYRILVYDNNFPGQTKYVTVEGATETWRYRTASDPDDTARDYVGSPKTESMSLSRMSDRNLRKFTCPFCEKPAASRAAAQNQTELGSAGDTGEEIYFSFGGAGDLLITDPASKQIGYDSKKKAEVNQISGAQIIYSDGGLDLNYSPEYALPYDAKAKKPYQVTISGKDLAEEVNADLQIDAPGFVVGFEDILLDPKEELTVTLAPDGQTLSFTASADGETPTIFVTTEDGPNNPSYSFEVGGVSIDAGKTVTMTADVDKGKVYFKDNDGNEDAYDVHFERTNPDGTKVKFDQNDLNLQGADNFEVDIDKWDKTNQPCIEDDDDGDGFSDETCGDADSREDSSDKKKENSSLLTLPASDYAWLANYREGY